MTFQLAVAQVSPQKADVPANIAMVAEVVGQAAKEGADLVVFPESAVTGYILEDESRQVALDAGELGELLASAVGPLSKPVDVFVGFYEKSNGQPHNSAAYFELVENRPKLVHVYRKFFLPTYGVFDEERFHQRGAELGIIESRFGRIGALICEDVWHSVLGTLLALNGAEVVLVPSASPVRGTADQIPGNVQRYQRMVRALSEEHGVYAAAAMLTGSEGGKLLAGGSMVFDPFGECVCQLPVGEPALGMVAVDTELVRLARARTPLIGDLRASWDAVLRLANRISSDR